MTGPASPTPSIRDFVPPVSLAALGLLWACESWAGWQVTDGFVPQRTADSFGPEAEVAAALGELVAAGIVVVAIRDGVRGWQVNR